MATYTAQSTLSTGIVLKLTLTQNDSSCNALLQLVIASSTSFSASYVAYSLSGDTSASGGGGSASYGSGTHTLLNKDFTKSGSVSVTGYINVPALSWNTSITASGGTTTPTISEFTVNPRTSKSLKVHWECPDVVDTVKYKIKPSGGSWTEVERNVTDGTSGNFTITDLQTNKKHYINLKVHRKSDGVESAWSDQQEATTYKVPTNTINDIYETSVNVTINCDSAFTKYQYSTDGGSNWSSEVSVSSRTSQSFTISSLTPAKSYSIKTRVYRTTYDGGVWENSESTGIKTYAYPSITSTPNFILGNDVTIGVDNPLSRTCTLYFIGDNGSTVDNITNTNNFKFTSTGDVLYYETIPEKPSGAYKIRLQCSDISLDTTVNGGTYSIKGTEYPSFDSSDWSYSTNYINTSVALANRSTVTVTINHAAAGYYTDISNYTVKWGSQIQYIIGSTGYTIFSNGGSSETIIVTAKDKRGLPSSEIQKSIQIINYSKPKLTTIKPERTDGVGEDVKLTLGGSFSNVNLYDTSSVTVTNTISKVEYAVSTGTPTEFYEIPLEKFTIGTSTYNLKEYQIYSDGSSANFTIGTRYNLKIRVYDKLKLTASGSYEYEEFDTTITDGKIAVDCYQDNNGDYHRGINGLGDDDYTETINGTLFAKDDITLDSEKYVRGFDGNGDKLVLIRAHIVNNQGYVAIGDSSYPTRIWANGIPTVNVNGNIYTLFTTAGGTLTGDLICNTWIYAGQTTHTSNRAVVVRNAYKQGRVIADTDGHFGLYDVSKAKWIVYSDNDGNVVLNGNATNVSQKKSLSAVSDSGWGTNNDYVPDMSFIAYWNGAYRDTYSNLRYSYQGEIQAKPTILYNNSSGSNGTITLSATSANYTYLEIFFRNNDSHYNSAKIYSPNGKRAALSAMNANTSSSRVWNKMKIVGISGTTIDSYSTTTYVEIRHDTNANVISASNNIYITAVIGYK